LPAIAHGRARSCAKPNFPLRARKIDPRRKAVIPSVQSCPRRTRWAGLALLARLHPRHIGIAADGCDPLGQSASAGFPAARAPTKKATRCQSHKGSKEED
jgi:hypothetical protein